MIVLATLAAIAALAVRVVECLHINVACFHRFFPTATLFSYDESIRTLLPVWLPLPFLFFIIFIIFYLNIAYSASLLSILFFHLLLLIVLVLIIPHVLAIHIGLSWGWLYSL